MAINALRFRQQHQETEFTKAGFLVYSGDAYHYHEWEFRTMTKYEATKAEDRWALGAKVVESLRGDAYTVAEDMGTDALKKEDPVKLIEALDNNRWNIEQPINSVIVKKAKQLQRRKEKPEDIPAWLLDLSKQQGEYILEKQIVLVNHHATQFSTLLDHPFPRRTTWILNSGRWQKTEDAVVISDLTDLHGSIQPVDIMINVFHE